MGRLRGWGVLAPAREIAGAASRRDLSSSRTRILLRIFRSKPEVARYLNVGEPLDEAGDEPASDSDSMKSFIKESELLDSD